MGSKLLRILKMFDSESTVPANYLLASRRSVNPIILRHLHNRTAKTPTWYNERKGVYIIVQYNVTNAQ
jgi:hypothetical protein